jgi:hypothetical protein
MRTLEARLATKTRKKQERKAHRERVFKTHPALVRYAKSKFKKGKKTRGTRKKIKLQLGVQ